MKAINLLPPDLRGTPKSVASKAAVASDEPAGIGAFVVLGALALCVAALAAYVLTTNTVKDREAQLDAVTANAQTTLRRVSELKPYADFQQMAETRIQTVNDLASSRFDWEQALRDLSRALPSDVTLTTLRGTVSSTAGGSGGNSLRGALDVPAVELSGCAHSQTTVARLMARLRAVDGVTRVSLSKSDKETQVQSSAAVAGGSRGGACGAGSPPAFELVAFFEGDAAAAAAVTGPAATAGAAATSPAASATPASSPTPTPAAGTSSPASTGATK
jgi:Tfp pilus assembly protein PilN